ncbi:MAG TPA: glycerol-3-phosphate dehydrogenase [Alphaproteobacteria bacterium]|nr:glycerol-3-phosphate dehydrogenase [Alphaproteobacteria bacterium]
MADFDLTIIGGGINGTAIARDAAGRGLKVLLLEKNDLASGTSSETTKLIHGGLRYLEQWEFGLVWEGLHERTKLLRTAPHLVQPLRLVLPYREGIGMWPVPVMQLGLHAYDALAGMAGMQVFPHARRFTLKDTAEGAPLNDALHTAFEFSDCRVDDARLVVLNAVDAAQRGADIRTRTAFEKAVRDNGEWRITFSAGGKTSEITSRALVNAAGPWVARVNEKIEGTGAPRASVHLVKGSHIVVKKLFSHDKAYFFQHGDGRIVFAIPYQRDFTLIGTTDVKVDGTDVSASPEEIDYLCKVVNGYFRKAITPGDVVWSYAGVRPLYDTSNGKSASGYSRGYHFGFEDGASGAPLVIGYGGKMTESRRYAEKALHLLSQRLPMGPAWTGTAPLPGGDFAWQELGTLIKDTAQRYPFLPTDLITRLVYAHGTWAERVVGNAKTLADMGEDLGAGLHLREVDYLIENEWARSAEDVLCRRTKCWLHMSAPQRQNAARTIENRMAPA